MRRGPLELPYAVQDGLAYLDAALIPEALQALAQHFLEVGMHVTSLHVHSLLGCCI